MNDTVGIFREKLPIIFLKWFFKVKKCLINCYDNHIILYKSTKRKRWKDDSVFLQIKMIYALVYCLLSVLLRFLQENDESDAYSIIL